MSLIKNGPFAHFDCGSDCDEALGSKTASGIIASVVHQCPPDGSGMTPCCNRTPFELPSSDRMTIDDPVTCLGPRTAAGLVEHASIEWRIKIAHEDRARGNGIMAQLSPEAFDRYIAVLEESR